MGDAARLVKSAEAAMKSFQQNLYRICMIKEKKRQAKKQNLRYNENRPGGRLLFC